MSGSRRKADLKCLKTRTDNILLAGALITNDYLLGRKVQFVKLDPECF